MTINRHDFGIELCKALNLDPDTVSRIIVDCPATGIVQVYVQMAGSPGLLEVNWSILKDSEFIILDAESE